MFKRLRDWIRERPSTVRFCLTVAFFVFALGSLLVIALRAENFVENLALNMVSEIIGALVIIYLLEGYMRRASGEMEKELEELRVLRTRLNDVLLALDHDQIDQSVAEKVQQVHALEKWMQGDVTGLYELCEMVRFAGDLHPTVRSTLKAELPHLQQEYPAGSLSARCVEQLQLSLSNSR